MKKLAMLFLFALALTGAAAMADPPDQKEPPPPPPPGLICIGRICF